MPFCAKDHVLAGCIVIVLAGCIVIVIITLHCYDELAKSSSPFVCYGCSLVTHRSEISRLQSEIDKLSSAIASLRSGKFGTDSSNSKKANNSAPFGKKNSKPRCQGEQLHPGPATAGTSKSSIPVDNARKYGEL